LICRVGQEGSLVGSKLLEVKWVDLMHQKVSLKIESSLMLLKVNLFIYF
jgi:hypothetical protein